MTESVKSENDLSLEDSITYSGVSLEAILCTDELRRRPSRPPDYEKENRALVRLANALADSPSTILQTLAETILDITECDSAGLSLLTKDGKTPDVCGNRFYWPAIAGMWNPHVGGGTPRNFGPCGDVLDQNRTLLFRHFERRYPYLLPVNPAAEECLLVPFYVAGEAVGTIWAIMHSDRHKFDAEDDRVMASLGKFASSAYQALIHIDHLKFQVSQREKAEAEVRELARGLEAKIRRLVDANIVGIVMWNLEGAITDANEAFLRMVQYDREDLVSGRVRWTDLTPPEWRERDALALANLKATGIFQPFEKEYYRKDGSRVPVLLGGAFFEGSEREGVAFIADLTDEKRAEEALQRLAAVRADASTAFAKAGTLREMLLKCVEAIVRHLDAAFARIWTLNKDENTLELQASAGIYTRVDGAYSRIHIGDLKVGWIARERKPHLTNDLLNDPRVSNKDWARACGFVSFAGYPLIVEDRVVGVMALFARHALSNATLDTLASVADAIAQGIERKRADEELRRAEETTRKTQTELAHVARVATLGELTASIAHEVNQPLSAIVIHAGVSLRWLAAQNMEEARQSIEHVVKAGHRASDIIRRIRALVKKTPPQKDRLDLNDIVREVITLARGELDMHHVALQLHLSDECPVARGDRIQIQQVLLNLIMNAIEAMSETEGSRTLRVGPALEDERHVRVTVQDSGPGFDPTQLNRLFEAFYSTKPGGLGMGLAISRSIIEAHGGRLWATANEPRGARFHFTLPIEGERTV
jgi:PAS domain S-box-containing protein